MKILLLILVIGLICADQSPIDLSQLSGEWRTLYIASSDPVKTHGNAPFLVFKREIYFNTENGKVVLKYYVMENGQCVPVTVTGTRIQGNVFAGAYAGANLYEPIYASETSMVTYNINLDENNEVTKVLDFLGRGPQVNEVDFEKFKELTQEMNIPEENIVNVINYDNCPENL
ncbi:odorant-binding protein-like [Pteronotus mesoamericanus]|uniref:odorant-binding protein-like n=1 Tax=Pteronotus mesoamericanus TaxID=1884717 RepID=UPI0023EAD1D7|nr:odorant-binding protein-like [Pteronotus parnellii mesoamericanus]XP_054436998.1 odorant-binding protein-like [Pteronotus parnellii mesoamericanus]